MEVGKELPPGLLTLFYEEGQLCFPENFEHLPTEQPESTAQAEKKEKKGEGEEEER